MATTRRSLLAGLTATSAVKLPRTGAAGAADTFSEAYQAWQRALAEAEAYGDEWAKLETLLFRTVGAPRIALSPPVTEHEVWVSTHGDLDHAVDGSAVPAKRLEALQTH